MQDGLSDMTSCDAFFAEDGNNVISRRWKWSGGYLRDIFYAVFFGEADDDLFLFFVKDGVWRVFVGDGVRCFLNGVVSIFRGF